jgi:hypothetical protein
MEPQSPLGYWSKQLKQDGEKSSELIKDLSKQDKADLVEYARAEMKILGLLAR